MLDHRGPAAGHGLVQRHAELVERARLVLVLWAVPRGADKTVGLRVGQPAALLDDRRYAAQLAIVVARPCDRAVVADLLVHADDVAATLEGVGLAHLDTAGIGPQKRLRDALAAGCQHFFAAPALCLELGFMIRRVAVRAGETGFGDEQIPHIVVEQLDRRAVARTGLSVRKQAGSDHAGTARRNAQSQHIVAERNWRLGSRRCGSRNRQRRRRCAGSGHGLRWARHARACSWYRMRIRTRRCRDGNRWSVILLPGLPDQIGQHQPCDDQKRTGLIHWGAA